MKTTVGMKTTQALWNEDDLRHVGMKTKVRWNEDNSRHIGMRTTQGTLE